MSRLPGRSLPTNGRAERRRRLPVIWLLLPALSPALMLPLAACTTGATVAGAAERPTFSNPYAVDEDTGGRVSATYFLRRAWVQITRDLRRTEVPPVVPLDLDAMARRPFAVSWLGHSAMLLRVGTLWVLLDPVLTGTAGPVAGFGPARLTRLPFAVDALPHIDVVLVSHDHYDHLDLPTMRRLARQPGGAPRFLVGQGLGDWFDDNVPMARPTPVRQFAWWQHAVIGDVKLTFVPAQHNSGRGLRDRNARLWGGWVVEHVASGRLRRFYFAGDTAYVGALFRDIRARVGSIDLAAIPIGAYQPRPLMRFDHTDPDDAVRAHIGLRATRSFGVHWGTFQLGDEEPFEPARDLAAAVRRHAVDDFGLLAIGAVLDVGEAVEWTSPLVAPPRLLPARAGR